MLTHESQENPDIKRSTKPANTKKMANNALTTLNISEALLCAIERATNLESSCTNTYNSHSNCKLVEYQSWPVLGHPPADPP